MKQIFTFAFFIFSVTSFAQTKAEATFDQKGYKFDNLTEGDTLSFYYYFTNTGGSDLLLKSVKPTCGCTIADWPKYAIQPGQRDSIFVTFDTKDRVGYNAKGINIMSNVGEINLVFEAVVRDSKGNLFTEPEDEIEDKEEDHSGHNH